MPQRHAIIIGSGVAGPLAALALQKAGVSATIYEAYPDSAALSIGAWLTVAVNGLDALRTLQLHDAVKACGFASENIEFFSGTGKQLGSLPIGGRLADGTVTHTLKRADLYRTVSEAAIARGVRIEYGKRFEQAVTDQDAVIARFEDGSEARGDLLLGSDGVHSRVRRAIDPAAPAARYTGFGNIGGFAPVAPLSLKRGVYRMVFGKRCFFGYTVTPSGECWWFANPASARELSRDELAAIDWRARLGELFADDQGPMLELIRATPGELPCSNQYDLEHVAHWQRDRVLIVGDAAHAASPSSGQGVSMAAEDAVVLGACMRDHGDTATALAAFVTARRERAEQVVAYGQKYANSKSVGAVGRFFRDLALPMIFRRQARAGGDASLRWLFDHHIEWQTSA